MNHSLRHCLLALVLSVAPMLASADPPGRVGRLSHVSGDVALRAADADDWEDAPINRPVTGGDRLSTGPRSRAEVRIGSSAVRLDGDSDLAFSRLDDERIGLRLDRGSASLRIRSREQAGDYVIETPGATLLPLEPGRYRLDAGRDGGALTVFEGSMRFEAASTSLTVRPGDRLEFSDGVRRLVRNAEPRRDDFDDWALARDRRDESSRSARYVSPEMTGYEDLDDYGTWRDTDDYGPVWMPRGLPVDWAPYRTGRWVWIEPWGWTWVDEMPWGFAPFHYGRWALVGGAWAWAPGAVVARPVYAPALVAWVGSPGWSVSLAVGSVAAVGWFPLAPREVFVPAYKCSTAHLRSVNITHVTNITRITGAGDIDVTRIRYKHRDHPRAVTVVPARTLAEGRHVGREAVPVRERRELADLPATRAAPDVRPERRAGIERRRERLGAGDQRPGAASPAVRPEPRPEPAERGRIEPSERRAARERIQGEPSVRDFAVGSQRREDREQRRGEERGPERARPAPPERSAPRVAPPPAAPAAPAARERQDRPQQRAEEQAGQQWREQEQVRQQQRAEEQARQQRAEEQARQQRRAEEQVRQRAEEQARQQQRAEEQVRQQRREQEQVRQRAEEQARQQRRVDDEARQQRQRADPPETARRRAEPPAARQPAPPPAAPQGQPPARPHEQRGMAPPRGSEGMRGMEAPRGAPEQKKPRGQKDGKDDRAG